MDRLQVNVTLSPEDSRALDALVARVRKQSGIPAITRSTVAAVALLQGMEQMKRELAT